MHNIVRVFGLTSHNSNILHKIDNDSPGNTACDEPGSCHSFFSDSLSDDFSVDRIRNHLPGVKGGSIVIVYAILQNRPGHIERHVGNLDHMVCLALRPVKGMRSFCFSDK